MPTHDIIDNRHEKLVDHINRILGSTEAARFAVGYFFLSGLTANSLPLDKQDIRNSLHANARRVRRSQDKLRSLILASKPPSPFD